jgi:hypothetical protein
VLPLRAESSSISTRVLSQLLTPNPPRYMYLDSWRQEEDTIALVHWCGSVAHATDKAERQVRGLHTLIMGSNPIVASSQREATLGNTGARLALARPNSRDARSGHGAPSLLHRRSVYYRTWLEASGEIKAQKPKRRLPASHSRALLPRARDGEDHGHSTGRQWPLL